MITITTGQRTFASYASDVLIYLVVLNLFVEYTDVIEIDSFTISIFTAFVLKILLDVVLAAEHRVSSFFAQRAGRAADVLRVLGVWLILFSSKFLILEVIDLIFGDHVELGGFISVMGLVIAMMVARALLQRLYRSLGSHGGGSPAAS